MASTTSTWLAVALVLAAGRPDRAATPHPVYPVPADLQGECGRPQPQSGPTSRERAKRSEMWWRDEDTLIEFGIDKGRSKELEAIFQQTLPIMKAEQVDVVRKEAVLRQLLAKASTANESAVVQAVEDLEASRRSLSRTFTMMQYYMYLRLTSSQRAKVHAYLNPRAEKPAKARSTPQ